MSSGNEKWGYKVEMTMKDYFNPPLDLPHKGVILLVRELEKILGKEKAHKLVAEVWTKEKVKNVKESVKKNPYASFQDWVQRHEDGTSMWTHANIDEPSKVTGNTRGRRYWLFDLLWTRFRYYTSTAPKPAPRTDKDLYAGR